MPDPRRKVHIEEDDAKAGSNEGVVRWVLGISLLLAIVAMTVIWVTGALTQDSVESAGTTTGRIEAEREQQEGGGDMNVAPAQIGDAPDAAED